jgi:hypothetical protein
MTTTTRTPLVAACNDWIDENLHYFAINWSAEASEIYRRLKPYAELGLLLFIGQTAPAPGVYHLHRQLTGWLADNGPDPDALEAIAREFPQAYPWAGMIWQHRAHLGLASPELRRAIESLSSRRSVAYFERPVGHEIGVYNVMKALHHETPFTLPDLYSRTMLATRAWDDPSDAAIYFICHDIFFLTDFGKRALPEFVMDKEMWRRKLLGWYNDCAIAGKVDLAAELWLAFSFMRAVPIADRRHPLVAIEKSGLPPSPAGQGSGFVRPGDTDGQIAFFQNYHTVLVCLMALAWGWPNENECREETANLQTNSCLSGSTI